MSNRTVQSDLSIDNQLYNLVADEILPGLDISADQVWQAMATLLREFQPRNRELLAKREDLQAKIDHWHENHPHGSATDYKLMLQNIGYLVTPPAEVSITTDNVDKEIATIAGPQLVVP
ncbi:MAG: malate synthase G, partial [Gammaproteobacteria bacterium]|nr:malate synthase G [Gammaproteobacteria bacterium]